MSGFDARWKELAGAARRHERDSPARNGERVDTRTAAAIASRARPDNREFALSDLRGMVIAASLCCACLSSLAWSANRFGYTLSVDSAPHDLARITQRVPATNFIPPPPGLAEIGLASLPELDSEFAVRPGVAFLDFLDDWLAPEPTTTEISR